MDSEMDLIKTDAGVERVWVAAPSDEQMDEPMHTTPSGACCAKFGNDTDVIVKIVKRKMKYLITEEVESIYGKQTQAEV